MAGGFGRQVAGRVREEISDALEARVPGEDADSLEDAPASRYLWIVMRFEFESESAMGREVSKALDGVRVSPATAVYSSYAKRLLGLDPSKAL